MLKPLTQERWDFGAAAHLLNRAGFGGPPAEIEKLVALGPETAVAHLVDYEGIEDPTPPPAWARPDPDRAERLAKARQATPEERRKLQREEKQNQRQHLLDLQHWWLQRMATGPRPFQEKMVLFWHGHFATSVQKVRDGYLMWRQNELFRRLDSANWLELLRQAGKDPAMLIWLDQAQSRKEHPNENFAREVMELFSLGEGHYTEKDIAEAARALTGWSYDRQRQLFVERPLFHDPGLKTIFGQTGRFDGDEFLGLVVQQPQAARFITARLWKFFAGEEPSDELASALAAEFRRAGLQFKPLLRALFLSEEFYTPRVVRNQVKSPVQWLVGSVRMLERELPPPLVCVGLLRSLGQELFAPPNVKGWDGGLSWITTNTLLARYNEAATLVQGELAPLAGAAMANRAKQNANLERRLANARLPGVNAARLFPESQRANADTLLAAVELRLLQERLKPKQEAALREYLAGLGRLDDTAVLNTVRLVMSTPDYQVA
jgi:uncharacterized protein (DUF1800 family)